MFAGDCEFGGVIEFLRQRQLMHLQEQFVISKIDDSVAPYVVDKDLHALGLVEGDIIGWRLKFQSRNPLVDLQRRAAELANKLLKRKNGVAQDSKSRPIYHREMLDFTFHIKCKEKQDKYILKKGKSMHGQLNRNTTYNQTHALVRKYYKIPDTKETFIGNYKGKDLRQEMETIGGYVNHAWKHKLVFYLYYPFSYRVLCLDSA